jgi:hypothetical protein
MGSVRRMISLGCALALTCGGAVLTIVTLTGERASGKLVLAAAGMLGIGLIWLWADFTSTDKKSDA